MDEGFWERIAMSFLCVILAAGALVIHLKNGPGAGEPEIIRGAFGYPADIKELEAYLREQKKVNINSAGVEALVAVPGIGKATALRIVNTRNDTGPFFSASDLERVPGIGPKKAEKLAPFLRFK